MLNRVYNGNEKIPEDKKNKKSVGMLYYSVRKYRLPMVRIRNFQLLSRLKQH